jgi:hypothetical protein
MPGRSAGSWEGRPASAPPMAPPAAAPPAIPRKFPTSLLLGRWAGLVPGRCAVPLPGWLGSCEGRSAAPPGLLGSCDGRSALPGLLGSCEGRSAPSGRVVGFEGGFAAPPGVPGLLGRSEGRSPPSGRVVGFEGRCVAPAPPERHRRALARGEKRCHPRDAKSCRKGGRRSSEAGRRSWMDEKRSPRGVNDLRHPKARRSCRLLRRRHRRRVHRVRRRLCNQKTPRVRSPLPRLKEFVSAWVILPSPG